MTVTTQFLSLNNLLALPLVVTVTELVSPYSLTVTLCPIFCLFHSPSGRDKGFCSRLKSPFLCVCMFVCVYVCVFWWETLLAPQIKALR